MVDTARGAETIGDFLERLGAGTPTPAGGAVAALCAAQAAALIEMVARSCDAQQLVVLARALVVRSHELAVEDEAAFAAVATAWALPRDATSGTARRSAVDAALVEAARPQVRVVEAAAEVLELVEQLRPCARGGVRADLLAAAEVARAASTVARTNVESNLRGLPDTPDRTRLLRRVGVTEESA